MQRHALPRERHQHRTLRNLGTIGCQHHRVQRRVQHHRMDPEPGHRDPGICGQRHLGEHFIAAAPHRGQAPEGGPVHIATLGQPLIPIGHVYHDRTDRRPHRQIRGRLYRPRADYALRMQLPAGAGFTARKDRHRAGTRLVRTINHYLHRDRAGYRHYQWRGQIQLVDNSAAHLVAGADRQLDKPGPGEQHHAAHGVIVQPALHTGR